MRGYGAVLRLRTWPCAPEHRPVLSRGSKGDPGVAIGTLADVLVVLGLVERLADLIDVRKDDLGLALSTERLPQRGKSFATRIRKQKAKSDPTRALDDVVDPDGASF